MKCNQNLHNQKQMNKNFLNPPRSSPNAHANPRNNLVKQKFIARLSFKPEIRAQIQRNNKLVMETFKLEQEVKRERDARSLVKKLMKDGYNAKTVVHKTSRGQKYAVYVRKK